MADYRHDGHGDVHCYRIESVMNVIDVMAMVMELMDIVFCDEGDNDWVRCNSDGDGSDGHCYRI